MSTRKRAASHVITPDQPPVKRHAKDQQATRDQGDFKVQTKLKKHYEFDWIHNVQGLVRPKKNHQVDAGHIGTGAGLTSGTSAKAPRDDSEDLDNSEGSETESSDMEDLDELEDSSEGSDSEDEDAVGGCYALLMDPDRRVFDDDMEEPSEETSALTFELFDRYGRLRPEFKEQGAKKGSGIWKDELDDGQILLIENIRTDKSYRRQGWARKAVAAVLEAAHTRCKTFIALTQPGVIYRDYEALKESLTDEEKERFHAEELRVAVAFCRSVGFRRVGSSGWFALASIADHECHTLAASDDYDPPSLPELTCHPAAGSLLADIATMEFAVAVDTVRQAFRDAPIPTARPRDAVMDSLFVNIATDDDDECVQKLTQALGHLPVDDARYEGRDRNGNTILHAAATNFKPKTLKWLMEKNASLASKKNGEQETPLEALQYCLESHRTRSGNSHSNVISAVSDNFKGFSEVMVACLCLLEGRINPSLIDLQRLTFGCTCGQCIAGFLSPRMRLALLCQANFYHDVLRDEVEGYPGPLWVEMNDFVLGHVPSSVRANMTTNKSMRAGFANLCNHFATCLDGGRPPTGANVLNVLHNANEWFPVTKHFLERGGSVPSVGSMLFEMAMNHDELAGDGDHKSVFEHDIAALPECRNDHEFGFVSSMCGYKRVSNIVRVGVFDHQRNEDYGLMYL
jgi:GNAT superfamily N-acetyltransferase